MNSNRMKYAWTPTYGLNKKGLLKKSPQKQAPQTPDFTKMPEGFQAVGAQPPVFQQPSLYTQQQPPAFAQQQPVYQQPSFQPFQRQTTPASPYFPQSAGAGVPQTARIPFATPSFVQPATQAGMPPPLANSAPTINMMGSYPIRSQGYVPPTPQRMPTGPSVQAAPFSAPAQSAPAYSPMPQTGYARPPYAQASAQPMQDAAQAHARTMPGSAFGPVNAQPMQSAAFAQPISPPMQSAPPQSAMPPQAPAQPRQPNPAMADRLWAAFLFVLLPLMFIPCLFVSSSLDFVRYAFMALTVCGLGGMWYRQMFTPVARFVVSVVYVALCVVVAFMMFQGSRDAQQTGGTVQPQDVQATAAPDGNLAAAATVESEPTPTPSPTPVAVSEAETKLETFMTLWMVNNTQEMVSFVQPSWASAQENPSTALFTLLANRTPEDFEIEDIAGTDNDNSRTVTMTATINKNNGKDPIKYRFMIIMVKEGGSWYVDPNSLATNDSVEEEEENVINNESVDTTQVSLAPRTTVSPAPPGSTVLYYNTNGGSKYHMDQYCSSVRDEYLPLTGSFLYSELSDYLSKYSPCLVCDAPTSVLSE